MTENFNNSNSSPLIDEQSNVTEISNAQMQAKDASLQLLEAALHAWLFGMLQPSLYPITRAFAHHMKGEKYDSKLIFDQLMALNSGKHAEFLVKVSDFNADMMKDFDLYLSKKKG